MPILRSKRARRGKSAPETSKSPVQDASRFIASPPKNAKEKEEFTRALETGLFQDELDLLGREGGHRRQDTPRRTRESTSFPSPFEATEVKATQQRFRLSTTTMLGGRQFVKVYVDDIITRSYTFTLHLHHLRQLFTTLRLNTVTLNPKKSFLGFPDVRLLGQHVDGFGLATL
ncbi:hypothetical protein ACN38_g2555 [Penicillium nordicum]|uniref:Uncharacterized protein n=1 Tax=Penicillium nordicum TaxID=229535 RepID=A0A0M8P753_9EURO|nr:hypothetical protein ACN38_g2555 [Penicillium nordicum]